jgi:hypothetical protein
MIKLINWLKGKNEYYLLLFAVLIFWLSPIVLRYLDPTAATFDAGILQVPIIKIFNFCILQTFVWMVIKLVWPQIASYFEIFFENDFLHLDKWQRLSISLLVYFLLFLILAFVSIS